MSWNKIADHLFDRYCVEGEDKELCNLMQEHDKEVRAKAIDEFAEALKAKCDSVNNEWNGNAQPTSWAIAYEEFKTDVDDVAELLKEGGK